MIMSIVPIPVMIGYAIAIGTKNGAVGYFATYLCAFRKIFSSVPVLTIPLLF